MQQKGFVSTTTGNMAKVIIQRESACGHSCDSCGGGCNSSNSIILEIENTLGVSAGEYVVIESKSSTILKSAFVAYIMPLIFMMVGVFTGMKVSESLGYDNFETIGFFIGILFLAISYVVLRKIDNKHFKNNDNLFEMISEEDYE